MNHCRTKCKARKGKYLLRVHKLTIGDENSIGALDSSPSCDETPEKNPGQEVGERVIRGFSYLNGRYPNRYTDNGDSFGNWIARLGRGAQVGPKYGFNTCDHSQSNFPQPKISQRHILVGSTLMDADARGDYEARSNIDLSSSMLFSAVLANSQKKSKSGLHILFFKRLLRHLGMNATRSEFCNGGLS
jgi:hypothetical protein